MSALGLTLSRARCASFLHSLFSRIRTSEMICRRKRVEGQLKDLEEKSEKKKMEVRSCRTLQSARSDSLSFIV